MSEFCSDALRCDPSDLRRAMSIHTRKITDSCRDKDCIEDLRVFLTPASQTVLDSASGVKVRSAELLYAAIEVEPVAFDGHHYCIDITFYYRIFADAATGGCRCTPITGLSIFSKRAVLCGEDSSAHIFRSDTRIGECDGMTQFYTNRPTAVVEVLDPMVLSCRMVDACGCSEHTVTQIPTFIRNMFDEAPVTTPENRRLLVTLGQFSIIRLERDAQLIVPVLDYAIPTKECCDGGPGCAEDPCEMFSRIPFPAAQFAPNGCDNNCNNCCNN